MVCRFCGADGPPSALVDSRHGDRCACAQYLAEAPPRPCRQAEHLLEGAPITSGLSLSTRLGRVTQMPKPLDELVERRTRRFETTVQATHAFKAATVVKVFPALPSS